MWCFILQANRHERFRRAMFCRFPPVSLLRHDKELVCCCWLVGCWRHFRSACAPQHYRAAPWCYSRLQSAWTRRESQMCPRRWPAPTARILPPLHTRAPYADQREIAAVPGRDRSFVDPRPLSSHQLMIPNARVSGGFDVFGVCGLFFGFSSPLKAEQRLPGAQRLRRALPHSAAQGVQGAPVLSDYEPERYGEGRGRGGRGAEGGGGCAGGHVNPPPPLPPQY